MDFLIFDPMSACRIEITVHSYFTVRDGRYEFNWGRLVKFIIDSEEYSVIDMQKDIAPSSGKFISTSSIQTTGCTAVAATTMASASSIGAARTCPIFSFTAHLFRYFGLVLAY